MLILVCLRNYIESMEVKALLCIMTYFHFAWKGTLRPNNSVQAYNSADCQKQLILMSQEGNDKTTKVAENKLVLSPSSCSQHSVLTWF